MAMNVSLNKKKIAIVMCCATVAVVIAAAVMASFLFRTGTIKKSVDLGDRYLSELDYDSAIQAYTNALSVDSLNKDALFGLAQCYSGKGDSAMARQILEDTLKTYSDAELKRYLANLYLEEEDYEEALRLITDAIEDEDSEEDYRWRDEILVKLFERGHAYTAGETVTLAIREGNVVSMGSNILGALGVSAGLGTDQYREQFANAEFPETAKKVYTMETSSAVIDENGSLWLAGSNRSGQRSVGSSTLIPEAGWHRVEELENVVIAGGVESTVLAVDRSGTLYAAGENRGCAPGGQWLPTFTPVYGLGTVIDLQVTDHRAAILNTKGELHTVDLSEYGDRGSGETSIRSLSWQKLLSGVKQFSVNGGSLVYISADGRLVTDNASVKVPDDWYRAEDDGSRSLQLGDVKEAAVSGDALLLLDKEGSLRLAKGGEAFTLDLGKAVAHIYSTGSVFVIQLEEGGYEVYDWEAEELLTR